MNYTSDFQWSVCLTIENPCDSTYFFSVRDSEGKFSSESKLKRLLPSFSNEIVEIYDDYNCQGEVFQTAPFLNCYFPHTKKKSNTHNKQWLIRVYTPLVEKNHCVAILGDSNLFGNWNSEHGRILEYASYGWWELYLDSIGDVEYKFAIIDKKTKKIVCWEDGNNRINQFGDCDKKQVANLIFHHHFSWKGAGVAIPLFSLRSESDYGIGDFGTLRKLVDWASKTGMKMLQILPVNDTTNTGTNEDSYPYRANSVHALHPIYLNINEIGTITNKKTTNGFEQRRLALNKKIFVDYANVMSLKLEILNWLFKQEAEALFHSEDYARYFNENSAWLLPYAVFSCLRNDFGTSDFSKWKGFSVYSKQKVEEYATENPQRVQFYYFMQYHAGKQLKAAHDYATKKGVALKGDLPIGISGESVDAWLTPEFFHLEKQAGAPPDDFSETGQNWGFPTYNWPKMAEDGFSWWKRRFYNLSEYFDAYRIDHILGFFRIWEIPNDAIDGFLGYFNPALPLRVDEIESYGLRFDKERMLKPFLPMNFLEQLFGNRLSEIADIFFWRKSADLYEFNPIYSTQKSIQQYFENSPNKFDCEIKKKLMNLFSEILFVEDPYQKELFHPRITPFETNTFKQLGETEKDAFGKLHKAFFYHRHNDFWKREAFSKLPVLLQSNDMLVCGEDLGMVPSCVPEVMDKLRILSLEVQRMPKKNETFVNPTQTLYMSVYTTGTHDTSSLRGWWMENRTKTELYYTNMLQKEGVPPESMPPRLAKEIIMQSMQSNSILSILPMQDLLAMDLNPYTIKPEEERINNPANPHHFWCFRTCFTMEELLKKHRFNNELSDIITNSGRKS